MDLVARSSVVVIPSQKAPSAKRCIKTARINASASASSVSQKAPSAKRCIKTLPS